MLVVPIILNTPIITIHLVQDLQNFIFVSETLDDIKTGLQPFIVVDGSVEHRLANLELSRTYGMLSAGGNSLLLADLEALKAKEVQSIPLTYFELERTLGMFGNLLGAVLGSTHVLFTAYRAFWVLLSQGYRTKLQQIIDNEGCIKPAHVLCSVQLVCYNWFTQKRNHLTPPPPDFRSILVNITLCTYLLPHLPPALYKLAYPKTSASFVHLNTPDLVTLSDGLKSSTSGLGSASVASGIALPMALTPPLGDTGRKKGSYIANLHPDRALTNIIDGTTKIKDLMGDSAPPHSLTMVCKCVFPSWFIKDVG
jgi:hypothetical protein